MFGATRHTQPSMRFVEVWLLKQLVLLLITICQSVMTHRMDHNSLYTYQVSNTIHMYSGITSGRVLNGELLYTKILEVNLFPFAYRLFRRDFSPLDGTYCMGTHSFLQPYMHFVLIWELICVLICRVNVFFPCLQEVASSFLWFRPASSGLDIM